MCSGGLSIGVEGPSKAQIQIEESKVMRGTCNCQYVPMAPGDYTIAIKHADQHIPGSPFTARVVGASRIRGPELQLSRGGGPANTTSSASSLSSCIDARRAAPRHSLPYAMPCSLSS